MINIYKKDNTIINLLIKRFVQLTGIDKTKIVHKKIHGWKYSYNFKKTPYLSSWNANYQLGLCGDWFNGPYAEDAWQSSNSLYKRIKKNPPK